MLRRYSILLLLLVLALPWKVQANSSTLVSHDLSLAGCRLGMSLDEASRIRSLDYVQRATENLEETPTFFAAAEHAYVDGAAATLFMSFRNEKAYKIVARISPELFENVMKNIEQCIGPGENKSKQLKDKNNENFFQTVFLWDFPNARIHLVKVSSNTEFMTISLTEK